MTLQELQKQKNELAGEIRKLANVVNGDEAREWNAEERERWEKINADYDALGNKIDVAKRADTVGNDLEAIDNPHGIGRGDVNHRETATEPQQRDAKASIRDVSDALRGWLGAPLGLDRRDGAIKAAQRTGIDLNSKEITFRLSPDNWVRKAQRAARDVHPSMVSRALSTQVGPDGGYLQSAEDFVPSIERAMLEFGGMLQTSTIITTATGTPMRMPTVDDTSNTASYVGQNTEASDATQPTFKSQTWSAYQAHSGFIYASYQTLRDSEIDVVGLINDLIGERLGRFLNAELTNGDGDARPYGLVSRAPTGVTTASSTDITPDETLDLVHSIDPAYRNGARWMLHDNVLKLLRKKKDGEGRYIWQSGMMNGAPDTLWGYPIGINQDMSSTITSGDSTAVFGRLDKYYVRRVQGLRLKRLEERFAENDQTAFIAYIEFDGDLLDAGTNPVKKLVQL